jgi:hypothetical protein
VVLFTALRCDLGACQVNVDLYTSGLMTLRHVTTQAAVATQVITGTHVGCYDLPKVGVAPQQRRDLGHAIAVSGAPITVIDRDERLFITHIQQLQSYKRPCLKAKLQDTNMFKVQIHLTWCKRRNLD